MHPRLTNTETDFDYKRYLASREWALLKNAVRERCGGRCERCLERVYAQTHHITYDTIGHEDLDDLAGLCRPCHAYLSGRTHEDPKAFTLYNPEQIDGVWWHTSLLHAQGNVYRTRCEGDTCTFCLHFSRLMAGLQ